MWVDCSAEVSRLCVFRADRRISRWEEAVAGREGWELEERWVENRRCEVVGSEKGNVMLAEREYENSQSHNI